MVSCALLPVRLIVMCGAEVAVFVVCATLARPPRRLLAACARTIVWCVGFGSNNVRFFEEEYEGTPPLVIVSNHASVIDGFILSSVLKAPSFLAKASLRNLPIYGTILRGLGVLFVDRESRESRRRAVAALSQRATADPATTPPLVIFPEGTTNNGSTTFRPFRAGAFRAGLPVRPVLIDYGPLAKDLWMCAADSEDPDSPLADLKTILRLVLSAPFHAVTVTVLPPYVPSAAERTNAKLYADNVRALLQKRMALAA